MKHDLAPDGFCLQPFYAPESALLTVFLCGAGLGELGRDVVVKLSAAGVGWANTSPGWRPRWTG